ncbi:Fur family transcriptional regulator [Clostridiales bacterium PH28_bin88]|nr:Fur family transcriptional regulator [Clostridiales bacterium PH28_bin88]
MNPKVQRMTRQKKVILGILRGTKNHPTADWVYEQARKELPEISLGTVYRNLNVLRDAGEIMELNYGSTFSRFDGNPLNHYHFVCEGCGQVTDLELPVMDKLEQDVARITGLQVFHHRLEFYGLCPKCKGKGNGESE